MAEMLGRRCEEKRLGEQGDRSEGSAGRNVGLAAQGARPGAEAPTGGGKVHSCSERGEVARADVKVKSSRACFQGLSCFSLRKEILEQVELKLRSEMVQREQLEKLEDEHRALTEQVVKLQDQVMEMLASFCLILTFALSAQVDGGNPVRSHAGEEQGAGAAVATCISQAGDPRAGARSLVGSRKLTCSPEEIAKGQRGPGGGGAGNQVRVAALPLQGPLAPR